MYVIALLLAATSAAAPTMPAAAPPCRSGQLRLTADGRDGDFGGMSHSGAELSIRNLGPDCMIPALPLVELRDARGRALPAARKAPVGMHPGPVVLPLRIGAGRRATIDLRWVSGPVFPANRSIRVANVTVKVGNAVLQSPMQVLLYGRRGRPVDFDQTPARVSEGMAAD